MPAREMLRRALRTARSTLRNARGVRFVTLRPIAKEERAQGRGLTAMSGQSPDFAIPRHVAHEPWELCAQIATANVRGREASKLEIEVVGRVKRENPHERTLARARAAHGDSSCASGVIKVKPPVNVTDERAAGESNKVGEDAKWKRSDFNAKMKRTLSEGERVRERKRGTQIARARLCQRRRGQEDEHEGEWRRDDVEKEEEEAAERR
ncbi:unnamed protein product [Lampetra planeri]